MYCCYESGIIVETELDDDEAEEYDEDARSAADKDTGYYAESSSEQLSKYQCNVAIETFSNQDPDEHASPITSVSSAFSDSTEDASTSEIDDDDVCVTLNFASSDVQQCITSAEKEQALTSLISTATEGSHTTPTCLDIESSTDIADITEDTSTSVADYKSVYEGLVSDDDTQAAIIPSLSLTEEAPVSTLSFPATLLISESGDDNQTELLVGEADVVPEDLELSIESASSVSVTFEDDITHASLPSTVNVEHAAYIPPALYTEDTTTTVVDLLSPIEDAGFSQNLALSQPSSTTTLAWEVVCTAGFALSSVPWLRIGVATAGIVVDVAATLLRG